MDYAVLISGVRELDELGDLAPKIKTAASRALNKTARDGRVRASRLIREQVAFPASYLGPAQGRLVVSRKASRGNLEAAIRGRGRPTSLARFVSSGRPGRGGATVTVDPGVPKRMRRAFLIKLRQGSALTETKFNLGLAIRLRPGERVEHKHRMVRMASGLYLLYGPSVDQVFDDVARDMTDEISVDFRDEFYRLLNL